MAADVAWIEGLAAEICGRHDVGIDRGDVEAAFAERFERQVQRGEAGQYLRAVAAAADQQNR